MKKQDNNQQIEDLQKEVTNLKNKYLRALADYQNLEKRVSSARINDIQFAAKNFILKILPVMDTFEQVKKTINDPGLQLALKQFTDVIKSENVERIEVKGKKFDPNEMECVEVAEDNEDGKVITELVAGYKMWGVVIRPAKVKVGKKKDELKKDRQQNSNILDHNIIENGDNDSKNN